MNRKTQLLTRGRRAARAGTNLPAAQGNQHDAKLPDDFGEQDSGCAPIRDDYDHDYDDEGFDYEKQYANYPLVGRGESDDVSVQSDLTIPSLSSGVLPHGAAEELYNESSSLLELPPVLTRSIMDIGDKENYSKDAVAGRGGRGQRPGGRHQQLRMVLYPPKRRNLLDRVRGLQTGGATYLYRPIRRSSIGTTLPGVRPRRPISKAMKWYNTGRGKRKVGQHEDSLGRSAPDDNSEDDDNYSTEPAITLGEESFSSGEISPVVADPERTLYTARKTDLSFLRCPTEKDGKSSGSSTAPSVSSLWLPEKSKASRGVLPPVKEETSVTSSTSGSANFKTADVVRQGKLLVFVLSLLVTTLVVAGLLFATKRKPKTIKPDSTSVVDIQPWFIPDYCGAFEESKKCNRNHYPCASGGSSSGSSSPFLMKGSIPHEIKHMYELDRFYLSVNARNGYNHDGGRGEGMMRTLSTNPPTPNPEIDSLLSKLRDLDV